MNLYEEMDRSIVETLDDVAKEVLEKLLGPTFIVVIGGGAGAGKTTAAEDIAAASNAVHVATNNIRERLRAAHMPYGDNVHVVMEKIVRCVLASGRPVVVDGMVSEASERELLKNIADEFGVPIYFIAIICDPNLAQARDKERVEPPSFWNWRPSENKLDDHRENAIPLTASKLLANLTDVPDTLDGGVLRVCNNESKQEFYMKIGVVWREILLKLPQ